MASRLGFDYSVKSYIATPWQGSDYDYTRLIVIFGFNIGDKTGKTWIHTPDLANRKAMKAKES